MRFKRLFVAALALPQPSFAQALLPREIAARTRPAVVLVTALKSGRPAGQGSGFIVSADGRIVTNRHVIEGADAIRVHLADGQIYDRVFFVTDDQRRDLAILRIPATDLPILRFGDDRRAETGDPVYVLGNPRGMEGTFSDGLVSSRRTVEGTAYLQISAPISPGSSGGPVLNAAGEVIGVATLTLQGAQNLNMAVAARYASGLLAMNETPLPFEQVASRLAATSQSASEPVGNGSSRSGSSSEEPWLRVLREEVEGIANAASKLGLRSTHELIAEMLNQDATYEIDYAFRTRGEFITVVGVCDVDCSDLDLAIFDANNRVIARDVESDDQPELRFRVTTPGKFVVRVTMAKCGREPCAFALQAFAGAR